MISVLEMFVRLKCNCIDKTFYLLISARSQGGNAIMETAKTPRS